MKRAKEQSYRSHLPPRGLLEEQGIREYTQRALQEFGDEASRELASFVTQESRLAGIRAEAIFVAVVAGLGKVALIKSEDDGEVYYQGPEIQSRISGSCRLISQRRSSK
jgi:hypothetical protein